MAFRIKFIAWICLLTTGLSGCALWHEIQPHRMRRLNRVPPPHLDPEFTHLDPVTTREPAFVRAQNVDW